MGIFDILGAVLQSAMKTTARNMAENARKFERENPDMDDSTRERLDRYSRVAEEMASAAGIYVRTSSGSYSSTYMGKTVSEWDMEWKSIGYLKDANLTPYNHCVGLYRHVVEGKTMYVGRAVELHNGGFRKRLSDYRRDSDSARKHQSGKIIYEHLDEIVTYILIVGDTEEAVEATKRLEGKFIQKYAPTWNRQINI